MNIGLTLLTQKSFTSVSVSSDFYYFYKSFELINLFSRK